MIYKKVIILGSVIALSTSFIAGSINKNEGLKNSENIINKDLKKKKVVFANKSINSFFYIIMNESVKKAAEEKGWDFEYAVADYDQIRQNNQIINFINKKPDAIITTAIDSEDINDSLKLAKNENIPVAVIDTDTTGKNTDMLVSFDNFLAGQTAAKEVIKRLVDKYGYEKGVVFNAYGISESNACMERKKGFKSIIKKYEDIIYIEKPGNGNAEDVKHALLEAFNENTNIDAVFCSSDQPARGMIDALKKVGKWKKTNEDGHVFFVTIDWEPSAIDNIKEGYYDASIVQDVVSYGNIVIDLLDKYTFNNEEVHSDTYIDESTYWRECYIKSEDGKIKVNIPLYVVDKDNVDDKRHWSYIAQEKWGFRYK